MTTVLTTLFQQHNLSMVAVAAVICGLSSFTSIGLIDRARKSQGTRRLGWIVVAALGVGFGIWSTHFIAMLAYVPGIAIGYQPTGTVASLLVAIITAGAGFFLASNSTNRSDLLLGGIVVGFGITGMHYLGMASLRIGGTIEWDNGLVAVSVILASALSASAMMVGARRSGWRSRVGASATLTAAIVSLHFTAMGAADLSNCFSVIAEGEMSIAWMATGVAVGSAFILGCGLFALFLDRKDEERKELEQLRLHSLADAAAEGLVIVRDGNIDGANSSFLKLTGLDRDSLRGVPIGQLFEATSIEEAKLADDFVSTLLTGKNGEKIHVEITSRTADLNGGAADVIAVRDIRARIEQQRETENANAAAAESDRRFRFLIQSVTDYAIYMLDTEGKVANWNAGAQRNKGYTADEIVGQHFSRFFSEDERAAGLPQKALDAAIADGKHHTEGWRYRKDGSRFWAMVMIETIRDDQGQHIGFVKITRDITRQHEDAERIAEATRNLELSLAHMSQGLALFGADQRIVVANSQLNEILGIPQNLSIRGLGLHDLAKFLSHDQSADPKDIDNIYSLHREMISGKHGGEITQEFPGGRSIRIVHRDAGAGSWVSTFEDISERKQSEEKIRYMAQHDGLTGLPNRGSFTTHLSSTLDRVGKSQRVAVLGIDLDRFKEVNDQLGHATGDSVLRHYAARISHRLQDGEFVARFGGDEFAAYKVFGSDAELSTFIERVQACVNERFSIDRNEVHIGASIGVAIHPDDGSTPEKLVSNADMAMYRAKANLLDRVCYYEAEMDEAARDRRSLARDLWDAAGHGQLTIKYQVQKSVSTGSVTGYEALLRWQHPDRGAISPADFIPVAEECGAILPIGEWVLRMACADAAHWDNDIKLAVNISPVQLDSGNLIDIVRSALAETGLPPHRLELEVTETAIIADKQRAMRALSEIKELGVTIAIDDFGTGYSSLETLRSFPFDKIKLDRSFMSEVETSKQAKAMVRAILALGRGLDVPVLAEGVETVQQLNFLLSEGCDEAQGYYLGRPEALEATKLMMIG